MEADVCLKRLWKTLDYLKKSCKINVRVYITWMSTVYNNTAKTTAYK